MVKLVAVSVVVLMFAVAAQYLYDRSKPNPLYSFGSPHGDVSNAIEEVAEEEEMEDDSDGECAGGTSDGRAGLHSSSSLTNLIRQKLSADDNGSSRYLAY